MKHQEFRLREAFWTSDGTEWRCSDIGTRTIVAYRVRDVDEESPNDPPYYLPEVLFTEPRQGIDCFRTAAEAAADRARAAVHTEETT